MANVIKNYNEAQDKEIISYSINDYIVGTNEFDRLQLTIVDENATVRNIIALEKDVHYFISEDKVFIKPNDLLDSLNYATGNYVLRLEYFRDHLEEFKQIPVGRNWREGSQAIEKHTNGNWKYPRSFEFSDQTVVDRLYQARAYLSEDSVPNLRHVIKEISTTGTEIRVRLASDTKSNIFGPSTTNLPADNPGAIKLTKLLRDWYEAIFYTNKNEHAKNKFKLIPNLKYSELGYNYDYMAVFAGNVKIPINNITFDPFTDPNNITLIIKLNQPVPTSVNVLSEVILRRLVKQTFEQTVYYISEIPDIEEPGFLAPDLSFNTQTDEPEDVFETYNELVVCGSTDNSTNAVIEQFVFSDYENLNLDYSEFKNHTVFGSAKQKLINFDYKLKTIEGHLNQISQSLKWSGSASVNKRRKDAFDEITKVKKFFTGYEKFLFHDNQSNSTSSAPGAGLNLAKAAFPIYNYGDMTLSGSLNSGSFQLNDYDGWTSVYKTLAPYNSDGGNTRLFTGQYRAEDRPFFNYSGSLYLSFIAKGNNVNITSSMPFKQYGQPPYGKWFVPDAAYSSKVITAPALTGSEYRYFVYEASMSYWAPSGSENVEYAADDNSDADSTIYDVGLMDDNAENFEVGQNNVKYIIVTNAADSGTLPLIRDTSGQYGDMMNPSIYTLDSILDFDSPRTGSIMSSGDLFPLEFSSSDATQDIHITEVKVTKKDPTSALPFSSIYSTTSSAYSTWYDGALASASYYDDNNPFALINNLPAHYQESTDAVDLRKFVHMMGEFYDIFQAHIFNLTSIHSKKYKQKNSAPHTLLPAIAEGLGWNTVSAISSSFADNLGFEASSFFNDETSEGALTAKIATTNQWQKIVNNLIYIYKKKGTMGSIRAILASFGIAPDVLNIMTIGGSNEEQNPATVTSKIKKDLEGLKQRTGNTSFISKQEDMALLNLTDSGSSTPQNYLKSDWWTNGATPDGIEFIMRPAPSLSDTTLLVSTGSGATEFWDLKIVASSSDATAGKLQLRLNHTSGSSGSLSDSTALVTTDYIPNLQNHKLWNVYLTRTSSSLASVSQSYKLYVARQDDDKIHTFTAASKSFAAGSGSDVNANFVGSGSVTYDSGSQVSGNLWIGMSLTGSLAEFRTWQYELSASKFKQHVLNYSSVVSNNPEGTDLIQHYRFNEKNSGSAKLKDASNNVKDFSLSFSDQPASRLKFDTVPVMNYKLSLRSGGDRANEQKIMIDNPSFTLQQNLNPSTTAFNSMAVTDQRSVNRDVKFVFSVVNAIDDYLVDRIADFNIGDKLRPFDYYSASYDELNTLRNTLMKGVTADLNKNMRHTAVTVREKLESTLKTVVPAHTKLVIGYEVKNDALTKPKIKHHKTQVQTGSDAGNLTGSLYITESTAKLTASFDPVETGSMFITESVRITSSFDVVETGSIFMTESVVMTASFDPVETGSLFITESVVVTGSFDPVETGSIFITESLVVESFYSSSKTGRLQMILDSGSISASHSQSMFVGAELVSKTYPSGTADQIATWGVQSVEPLSKSINTGTGSHLFVPASRTESGSLGDYNVGIDNDEYVSYYIGDYEHVSGTVNVVSGSDGQAGWYGGYNFDYMDYKNFFNQRILLDNNYLYDSKYSSSINLIKGRPIGTTLYFTESNGEIIYPSNHAFIVGSSKDFHSKLFYEGTINDGTQPVDDPRGRDTRSDLAASTASVAGSNTLNALYVQRTESEE